jgi:capsid protein
MPAADARLTAAVRALEAISASGPSRPRSGRSPRRPLARYDAAQTTAENRRHWANADALSADADASFGTRQILRQRSRYEVANNPWYQGILQTLSHDLIGVGPRLQMLTGSRDVDAAIEREFGKWCRAVRLASKLRLMRVSRAQDGEAFALLRTNPGVGHAVWLDLAVIEADRVQTPDLRMLDAAVVDGMVLDANGNVVEYHVLKEHPGGPGGWQLADYEHVPARDMIHWFRPGRPEQHRGVPEVASTLQLFADLRRYRKAVIGAAEQAACFAGILHTGAPPDEGADVVDPMVEFELERNMLLTAPMGWDMTQVKAEQPTTTHDEFTIRCINEAARPWSMPVNIAMCDSSRHNYASGRLDHQTYDLMLEVERGDLAEVGLDKILDAWMAEAVRVDDLLPRSARGIEDWPHQWFWRGRPHVDPAKEANAQETRLSMNTTTLAHEYAREGLDWEEQLYQRGREVRMLRDLGLSDGQTATPGGRETPRRRDVPAAVQPEKSGRTR